MLRENGTVRTQKRIDFAPLCSATFPSRSPDRGAPDEHLLVGTQGGALLIYRDMELLWSARLTHPATALAIGAFADLKGLIVSAGHDGALCVSYLGTNPPASAVQAEAKELNYEAMDEEHRRLLQVIRDSSSEHKPSPRRVTLRAQVPPTCDGPDAEDASVVSAHRARLRLVLGRIDARERDARRVGHAPALPHRRHRRAPLARRRQPHADDRALHLPRARDGAADHARRDGRGHLLGAQRRAALRAVRRDAAAGDGLRAGAADQAVGVQGDAQHQSDAAADRAALRGRAGQAAQAARGAEHRRGQRLLRDLPLRPRRDRARLEERRPLPRPVVHL